MSPWYLRAFAAVLALHADVGIADEEMRAMSIGSKADLRFMKADATQAATPAPKPAGTTQKAATPKPTQKPTTQKATTPKPTQKPTTQKTTPKPTQKPTTQKATTPKPTQKPTTQKATTPKPTQKPTTQKPTTKATTKAPPAPAPKPKETPKPPPAPKPDGDVDFMSEIPRQPNARCVGEPKDMWGDLGQGVSQTVCSQKCLAKEDCSFVVYNVNDQACTEFESCEVLDSYMAEGEATYRVYQKLIHVAKPDVHTQMLDCESTDKPCHRRCAGLPLGHWGKIGDGTVDACSRWCLNKEACLFAVWNGDREECAEYRECAQYAEETEGQSADFILTKMKVAMSKVTLSYDEQKCRGSPPQMAGVTVDNCLGLCLTTDTCRFAVVNENTQQCLHYRHCGSFEYVPSASFSVYEKVDQTGMPKEALVPDGIRDDTHTKEWHDAKAKATQDAQAKVSEGEKGAEDEKTDDLDAEKPAQEAAAKAAAEKKAANDAKQKATHDAQAAQHPVNTGGDPAKRAATEAANEAAHHHPQQDVAASNANAKAPVVAKAPQRASDHATEETPPAIAHAGPVVAADAHSTDPKHAAHVAANADAEERAKATAAANGGLAKSGSNAATDVKPAPKPAPKPGNPAPKPAPKPAPGNPSIIKSNTPNAGKTGTSTIVHSTQSSWDAVINSTNVTDPGSACDHGVHWLGYMLTAACLLLSFQQRS